MSDDIRTTYARLRHEHPTLPALHVLRWARHECAVDALAAQAEWEGHYRGDGYPMRSARIGDVEINVYADEEPFDWGDIEPTQYERADLEVIGVGVRVAGDAEDLDAMWGNGYMHGDMEREALSVALQYDYVKRATTEASERAYWSARGIPTED